MLFLLDTSSFNRPPLWLSINMTYRQNAESQQRSTTLIVDYRHSCCILLGASQFSSWLSMCVHVLRTLTAASASDARPISSVHHCMDRAVVLAAHTLDQMKFWSYKSSLITHMKVPDELRDNCEAVVYPWNSQALISMHCKMPCRIHAAVPYPPQVYHLVALSRADAGALGLLSAFYWHALLVLDS